MQNQNRKGARGEGPHFPTMSSALKSHLTEEKIDKVKNAKKKQHTTERIRWSSPTQLLAFRPAA